MSDEVMSDNEVYDRLIDNWDGREIFVVIEAERFAHDITSAVWWDTGKDKERVVEIVERALKDYDEHALIRRALSRDLDDFKNSEGEWKFLKDKKD